MRYIVQMSTGIGSAEVWRRAVEGHGSANVLALTADTRVEDEDNWRFAREVHAYLGSPQWVVLADGRTPMQVGRDERVVPNNRLAVCSRILKRELLRRWIDAYASPWDDEILLGFDWTEPNRHEVAAPHWAPFTVRSPLLDPPYRHKAELIAEWRARGIEPPRLYAQGFSHANCGGACVRGGQAQWELLLRVNRQRYLAWEADEESIRALVGSDVAILRNRRMGSVTALPLREFRERLERQPSLFDTEDWGACGCDESPAAALAEEGE